METENLRNIEIAIEALQNSDIEEEVKLAEQLKYVVMGYRAYVGLGNPENENS